MAEAARGLDLEKVIVEMPWWDSKKWNPKEWYPMPVGYMARAQNEYIIEGYHVFRLDPEIKPGNKLFGDIDLVEFDEGGPLIFSHALKICELHNQRRMLE